MTASRETLKHELLSLIHRINIGEVGEQHPPEIRELVEALVPLSPIGDPINQLPAVAGSWTSLYARFGAGHSKDKSHLDDSTLSLRTFKTFPDIPIRIVGMFQEIAIEPPFYNNVDFFETVDGDIPALIVIHGTYGSDAEDPRRFRVIFKGAEIRPRAAATEKELRNALGLDTDWPLKRDFKPARLHSDVVYLDDTMRINYGGMGGLYVLVRRPEDTISF